MKTRGFEICKDYLDKDMILPKRQSLHAVAYDLYAPEDIVIPSIWKNIFENAKKFISGNKDYVDIKPSAIYTGIKAYFQEDEVMIIANRSSGPSKMGLVMSNSIGIFECDYYSNPSNDGNIIFQYYNFFPTDCVIKKGDRVGQAYFQKFLITDNDNAEGVRQGGIGSTGK